MPLTQSTPCDALFDCPDTCGSLPQVDFSLCSPLVYQGDISSMYITGPGNILVNETDANEWGSRIALPQADPSKIIELMIKGGKAVPEVEEIQGAYGKKAYAYKHHRVSFVISQLSDNNYNMMRYYEVKKKAIGWYKTSAGKIYGGRGLELKIVLDQIIPENSSSLETLSGYIEWEYKIHPCRNDSVI